MLPIPCFTCFAAVVNFVPLRTSIHSSSNAYGETTRMTLFLVNCSSGVRNAQIILHLSTCFFLFVFRASSTKRLLMAGHFFRVLLTSTTAPVVVMAMTASQSMRLVPALNILAKMCTTFWVVLIRLRYSCHHKICYQATHIQCLVTYRVLRKSQ